MSAKASEFETHFPPRKGRVHEACGAGVLAFACALAADQSAAVIWISCHRDGRLFKAVPFYFVHLQDAKTQAWCMEEALGSGAVGLVVCERENPMNFRDMRRLQLAAERGQATGLLLLPERFASPVAETRWQCAPLFDAQDERVEHALQNWSLVKNKRGGLGQWEVDFDDKTHRIALV